MEAGHKHDLAVGRLANSLVDSGSSQHSRNFIDHYISDAGDALFSGIIHGDQVRVSEDYIFDIKCAGCCWQFLFAERRYSSVNMEPVKVKFGNARDETSCYVDGPQGRAGKFGVVKTREDINLGMKVARGVQESHSYQMYGFEKLSGLAVGAAIRGRIEAIAITQLRTKKASAARKVHGCYFSYADAALLELYRYCMHYESLEGQCCWPYKDVPDEDDSDSNGDTIIQLFSSLAVSTEPATQQDDANDDDNES